MVSAVVVEKCRSIDTYKSHLFGEWQGRHVFTLPRWIKTWLRVSEPNDELYLCLIRLDGEAIGVAPLSINGSTASFLGDPEICDYLDFVVAPGYETEFYNALLDDLSKRNVSELDLRCLRPESTVLSHLVVAARERNGKCAVEPDGVSVEMDLPDGWDDYLNALDGKQRHEIRRKLRRLYEETEVEFLVLEDASEIDEQLDVFLKMFRESRADKAVFMSPYMETFFRSMMREMSEDGILRYFLLRLNNTPAAAAVCFDYLDTMYLYNSGYNPQYSPLSAGLLCKILSIKHSIETGRKKYDFLKGDEPYKYHLGGNEVRLSKCRIVFKR